MAGRIEDYALIGDTRTAALVCNDGCIDWLCLPDFDSPAVFAALLGTHEHGYWRIGPAGGLRATHRAYRGDTLVLDTVFETEDGSVRLTDFMVPASDHRRVDLVRIVEGLTGAVPVEAELAFRFDYGRTIPWVRRRRFGLNAVAGPNAVELRAPVRFHGREYRSMATFVVRPGDRVPFTLTWHRSTDRPPRPLNADEALARTVDWWAAWTPSRFDGGPWREPVVRSLITLKALTDSATGGIVAAATTSLPEEIGGGRNWDYRYCWIRDATFTLYAFHLAGLHEELERWRSWLLRAVAGRPAQLQTLYGTDGRRFLPEIALDWLPGYEGSRPVRAGNGACGQFQLDVIGEVLDVMHSSRKMGLPLSADSWAVERALLDHLDAAWREPDEGLWEVRGPRRHFTHSKLMAWVAYDRAVRAVERFGLEGPVDQWRRQRERVRAEILDRSYDGARGAFVQSYDSREIDAAVLMMPLVGFLPAADPRMLGTIRAVEEELLVEGFVRRYRPEASVDGVKGGEGAFLVCTAWYADNLALAGQRARARTVFERLLAARNDVGLLAEEYDPVARRQLGNFPQAFSHVGLINTACNLGLERGPALARPDDGAG